MPFQYPTNKEEFEALPKWQQHGLTHSIDCRGRSAEDVAATILSYEGEEYRKGCIFSLRLNPDLNPFWVDKVEKIVKAGK